MSPRCPRALELAWRRGCWELAGKRKWRVRGPGRAEVQEEGGVLSRDPGWRRLIPLWTRSWRWGLGSPWGEGSRTPSSTGQSPPLGTPQFWTEGRRWVGVFVWKMKLSVALWGSHVWEIEEGGRTLLLRVPF